VDVESILGCGIYERIARMDDAVEHIVVSDETKTRYLDLAADVDRLFRAILPDPRAGEFAPWRRLFVTLADKIRALTREVDISGVMGEVDAVLDRSVSARAYVIPEGSAPLDLSHIDFEALRAQFERGYKHTQVERLRGTISARLRRMVRLNRGRMDFLAELLALIDEYNAGSRNVEDLFEALVELAQRLDEEEQRHIAENLSEEELAVFDVLTRPGPDLSAKEKREVKRIARELLDTLKTHKLVLDWRKRQQSRAAVQLAIQDLVWKLPRCYTDALCEQKSTAVYQHVYDSYYGAGQSVYAAAV
jgi:type I restriction enzyme R subunit